MPNSYRSAIWRQTTSKSGSDQTILGAILVRQGTAWFIKLQGDPELADRERAHFESFVQSLVFQP